MNEEYFLITLYRYINNRVGDHARHERRRWRRQWKWRSET